METHIPRTDLFLFFFFEYSLHINLATHTKAKMHSLCIRVSGCLLFIHSDEWKCIHASPISAIHGVLIVCASRFLIRCFLFCLYEQVVCASIFFHNIRSTQLKYLSEIQNCKRHFSFTHTHTFAKPFLAVFHSLKTRRLKVFR